MNAISVAQEHLAFWLGQEVTASEAWEALTGGKGARVSWEEVRAYMLGWLLSRECPDATAAFNQGARLGHAERLSVKLAA